MMGRLFCVASLLISFSVSANDQIESIEKDIDETIDACTELYEKIKSSNCLAPVSPWLADAKIQVGVSWRNMNVDLKKDEITKAKMTSNTVWPGPFITLALKDSYFSGSDFGWTVGLSYLDSYALYQTIGRSGVNHNEDLGTYAAGFMIAAQPSVFYAYGGNDQTPETYFRLGFGISGGYASLRGSAFLTEDSETVTPTCFQAGSDLVASQEEGSLISSADAIGRIKSDCELVSYNNSGFGTGARIFLGGRYDRWSTEVDIRSLLIPSGDKFDLQPTEVALTISYIFEI